MITAIVMIGVESDQIPEVAQAIADLDGVSEVYSVAGDVDLIAVVRVTGTLACAAPGTGAYSGFLARVEAGRADRDPFADGRSLGTRARPERVRADARALASSRLASPS